jgi:hypothetical protein
MMIWPFRMASNWRSGLALPLTCRAINLPEFAVGKGQTSFTYIRLLSKALRIAYIKLFLILADNGSPNVSPKNPQVCRIAYQGSHWAHWAAPFPSWGLEPDTEGGQSGAVYI